MCQTAPYNMVGRLLGGVKPRLLHCGHVELISGMESSVVEFQEAVQYHERLGQMIQSALKTNDKDHPATGGN